MYTYSHGFSPSLSLFMVLCAKNQRLKVENKRPYLEYKQSIDNKVLI